jgi:hypothetical protein
MSAVELQIVTPAHDTAIVGSPPVTFKGAITPLPEELAGVTLYYRWYSSLFPADKDRYSIHPIALTNPGDPLVWTPGLGTHVISFAATDRPGETEADLDAVQHGGVTGGSEGDGQCLIHVFRANLVAPTDGAALNQAHSTLEAEAPALWGRPTDTEGVYEPNPDYHDLNRLLYRWEFVPLGAPVNRNTVNFIPALEQLTFDPEPNASLGPIVIRYQGALPAELNGQYTLTLHVEDKNGILGGDQTSLTVNVA